MNRFQPTTFWGVTTYHLWRTASLGLSCYAASYAAMANAFKAGEQKIQGKAVENKPAPKAAVSAPSPVPAAPRNTDSQLSSVKHNVIPKPAAPEIAVVKTDVKPPAAPVPSFARTVETPKVTSPAQPQPSTPPATPNAAKEFTAPRAVQEKSGKKKKNRAKGLNSLSELTGKAKGINGSDSTRTK